ncbi:Bacterial regulatory protein, arsR family [uncultured archaeon]|nr:Bacterial regulatory protein, arsR family [uncultured archaeon]
MSISRQLMYWLIAGSRGGENRAKIILTLKEKPMNARQLSEKMGVHYTTIEHHLEVLVKNGFLAWAGEKYGKMYFLSQDLVDGFHEFEKIIGK